MCDYIPKHLTNDDAMLGTVAQHLNVSFLLRCMRFGEVWGCWHGGGGADDGGGVLVIRTSENSHPLYAPTSTAAVIWAIPFLQWTQRLHRLPGNVTPNPGDSDSRRLKLFTVSSYSSSQAIHALQRHSVTTTSTLIKC